ncbi:hypothetical protein [Pseudomonas syringae group genomosp. 7]|uniref:hypothetical protein n=1 Tax=Pseudomonas syringae group genomosp. 7 TaxID=251699 RepID=UPI00377025CE
MGVLLGLGVVVVGGVVGLVRVVWVWVVVVVCNGGFVVVVVVGFFAGEFLRLRLLGRVGVWGLLVVAVVRRLNLQIWREVVVRLVGGERFPVVGLLFVLLGRLA